MMHSASFPHTTGMPGMKGVKHTMKIKGGADGGTKKGPTRKASQANPGGMKPSKGGGSKGGSTTKRDMF